MEERSVDIKPSLLPTEQEKKKSMELSNPLSFFAAFEFTSTKVTPLTQSFLNLCVCSFVGPQLFLLLSSSAPSFFFHSRVTELVQGRTPPLPKKLAGKKVNI